MRRLFAISCLFFAVRALGFLDCAGELGNATVRVAVFDDRGVAWGSVRGVARAVGSRDRVEARTVNAQQIRDGVLKDYQVVVFAGGSASQQRDSLGDAGVAAVKEFVAGGGGYVGLCAGAYMAALSPDRYGIGLLAVRILDRENWRRGRGSVQLQANPTFAALPWPNQLTYVNGPLVEVVPSETLPAPTVVATFASDISQGTAIAGRMPGTPAVLRGTYERGRVVTFSPHPELTAGGEDVLYQALRWAGAGAPKPAINP